MKRSLSILLLIPSVMLFTSAASSAKGLPPEGRTYFVYVMGLEDDPYEISADCLEFDATHACSVDDQFCLAWQRTEGGIQTNKEFGLSFSAEIDDDGLLITMGGQGRVEARGRRNSLSAVGRASALHVQLNFTFFGREVGKGRCLRMVEDFFEAQSAAF